MITIPSHSQIAVIGLGRVGRNVARFLLTKGLRVYVYDDNMQVYKQRENMIFVNDRNFMIMNDRRLSYPAGKPKFAVSSPGFSEQSKIIKFLRHNSIPIIDEIEYTASIINNPIIAVTGTNGKSTATALLGKMIDTDGKNVFWGGNLAPGLPFSMTLFQEPKDYYVIEISSFQLERCIKFHPCVSVLLNITADHLDRHASLDEYQTTKFKIFANQNKDDFAVINFEDTTTMLHQNTIRSKIIYFSRQRRVDGAYLNNNYIFFKNEKIGSLNKIKLLGHQYIDSILAAVSVAKILKIKNSSIVETLKNFTGLEHRLEFVAELNGVKYINNSMCTNPSAGAATLQSFTQPVILIAGGKEKKLEVSEYIISIISKAKMVILAGQNRIRLEKILKQNNFKKYQLASSLNNAVSIARKYAVPNDIVLFSPGFASFDTFANFQERGTAFKEIVYGLEQ